MPKKYEGQEVKTIRAAQENDKGFDPNSKQPQSLVTLADGSTKVVPDSKLTD